MLQQYNRIKFSFSAANRMKIKSLTHNRTIKKCFSLYEKHIFDFTTMICGIPLLSNTVILCLIYRLNR